ncbi:MAG: DUF928 domain-containing protein [Nitrospira sp.]|nr:DUF928 domain-containing protein [Nitrospira sp.]MBH0182745.1 DUF928 domain-containing protein [Nitrospira sp.]
MKWYMVMSIAAGLVLSLPGKPMAEEKPRGDTPMTIVQSGVEGIAKPLLYIPPRKGAPAPGSRRGGGTRGMNKSVAVISVLAPDHVGWTLQTQPVLYWFASTEQNLPYEFVLIADSTEEPVVEARLPQPARPGIQQIRLFDYHVRLAPGKRYHWSVALVLDSDEPSGNIVAKGIIEQVDQDKLEPPLPSVMAKADAPKCFAESGVWYDAVAAISDLIQSNQREGELLRQRALLLEQGGLGEVAARMLAMQASSEQ